MLILLDKATGLAVNPDDISAMSIGKAQGRDRLIRVLIIRMKVGAPIVLDDSMEINIYEIHGRLLEAK